MMFTLIQTVVHINAIDRLPTRLFLYPLFVLLILACLGLEKSKILKMIQGSIYLKIALFITFIMPLIYNFFNWSAPQIAKASLILEKTGRNEKPVFDTKILNSVNASYVQTVNISLLISFLSLIITCVMYFYFRNKINKNANVR